MSLKALIDFSLHLESFRNIDLVNQGVYRFKIRLYQELKDKNLYAHPYFISECYKNGPTLNSTVNKPTDSKISHAHISEDISAYMTRSFLIRFCEEEVELNEICHFQAEVDALPDLTATTFFLVVELIHSTYSNIQQKADKKENEVVQLVTSVSTQTGVQIELKTLETFTGKIKIAKHGIHEYVPIIFDSMNFSLIQATFHAIVLDYRFRVDTTSFLLTDHNGNEIHKSDNSDRALPRTFGEYIKKHFKTPSYERLNDAFTSVLKENYEQLVSAYNEFSAKCLMENHKKKFKSLLQPPMKLIIPDIWKSGHEEFKENDKSKDRDLENLASAVLSNNFQEINFVGGEVLYMWFKFMELIKITPRFILEVLKYDYIKRIRERWGESFVRNVIRTTDFSVGTVSKAGEKHSAIATKKRKNLNYQNHDPLHCEDINMIPSPESQPILFEHIYLRETKENMTDASDVESLLQDTEPAPYKGIHLVILVHGFQGNAFDMKLIKNNLSMLHPEALILSSSANEENTENDIMDMGLKLANEIKNFINETCPANFIGRISFVGYSLGGLVVRACLPHLEEYSEKMHTYFSLCSPHLGNMYNSNKIVEAGLWILKKWKKSLSLSQLSIADASNHEDSCLYKLSQTPGLNWFKNVALVSSWQDQYAPFESARIEVCPEALSDSSKGTFHRKMTRNILESITAGVLYRIDVNFKITESNLDTMIGRAAHIRFLESQSLIRMLLYRYEHFFA